MLLFLNVAAMMITIIDFYYYICFF